MKFDIAPILVEEGIEILSSTLLLKLLQLGKHLEQEADTRQRGGSGSNLQL